MTLSDYLAMDDLTVVLGMISASLFVLHHLYKPQPLVHPILLGRQSDVAQVRQPSESAVYRNYSIGSIGRLPTKAHKDVNVIPDILTSAIDVPRILWSTRITTSQLYERAAAFKSGLAHSVTLVPRESTVLLLLDDCLEFLISDLALATHAIPSFTISSLSVLTTVLLNSPAAIITSAEFLPQLLEVLYDSCDGQGHTIVVVGNPDPESCGNASAAQIRILTFAEVEAQGAVSRLEPTSSINPTDMYSVAFSQADGYRIQGVELSHQSITSSMAAIRALLPVSNPLSSLDTIVSSHSLSTAFGRALAYTALLEGANFATLDSTKMFVPSQGGSIDPVADVLSVQSLLVPPPSLLFVQPRHLDSITKAILNQAKKSWLHFLAWRHKIAGLREGYITNQSLWDRLVYDSARVNVLGEGASNIRGVIVGGGFVEAKLLEPARIAFSVPIVITHIHPLLPCPIFASHPFDLQIFPIDRSAGDDRRHIAHVGPPSISIEVKLTGVNDQEVERGLNPRGSLVVRGPPVGHTYKYEEEYRSGASADDHEAWLATGQTAIALKNGTFKICEA